ncbi:MAG: polyprenyl synthetase family protein [Fimbriimonadales bacterium]
MQFEEYAAIHGPDIERRLEELIPGTGPRLERLHEAMHYAVLGGGKRFRPLLCIAAAESNRGSIECVLDAACALELIHCFSLVHDDLPCVDNDDLRRGRPATHIQFGEAIALLAGDALFALAFETLLGMDAPSERTCRAAGALAAASGTQGMVGGQTVDIESENAQTDLDTVKWIHARKTGALITASCTIAAVLVGAAEVQVATCARFGDQIGLAFQIADDVLDETGDVESLGKRTRADKARYKATFPALIGVEASRTLALEAQQAALAELGSFDGDTKGLAALAAFASERTV